MNRTLISLRLPTELADRLDAQVTACGHRSRGDAVRTAITEYVERCEVTALARDVASGEVQVVRKRSRST